MVFDDDEEITSLDKARYPCPECRDPDTRRSTGKKKGQSGEHCPLCAGNRYVTREVYDLHRRGSPRSAPR